VANLLFTIAIKNA